MTRAALFAGWAVVLAMVGASLSVIIVVLVAGGLTVMVCAEQARMEERRRWVRDARKVRRW